MKAEKDHEAEAAALNATPPVRYAGMMCGAPMYQQNPPGVGSFMCMPGETVPQAYERARKRYAQE
jgi:hypothetical protein